MTFLPPSGTFFPSHLKSTEITKNIVMALSLFSLQASIQDVFNQLLESQVGLKITAIFDATPSVKKIVELYWSPKTQFALH